MPAPLLTVAIRYEHDVVLARQRARQVASLLGFDSHDQVRIATAVSEIVRNAFRYANRGKAVFSVETGTQPAFEVRVTDQGPGISNLQDVLDGRYKSATGMGLGILGARRLMDQFQIQSTPGSGTSVILTKLLPKRANISPAALQTIVTQLTAQMPQDPFEELQRQNQELLGTLSEVQRQRAELAEVNRELEDTNRGVVALYAELDERAHYLRRASELKTQFLSNMTHEFRTPLNSILSLSRILLDRIDGELTSEQEKQVRFIQNAANGLYELVNDLLDLAKVEAGKLSIRPEVFQVQDLFGALRGMLRPLLAHNSAVNLVFDEPDALRPLYTDQSKISQVLRNLISNALKFTARGEVRITAASEEPGWVLFKVSDTGVGIAPEDQDRIFEEFVQVEGEHQVGKTGTGLGLPLSRKLAELLGGTLTVQSALGQGATFTLRIPAEYPGASGSPETTSALDLDPARQPVLIVEDDNDTLLIYEKFLKNSDFQPLVARTLREAQGILARVRPVAIVLDVLLGSENTWSFLGEFKRAVATRDIPVIVVTMVENENKAYGLGADAFHAKPIEREWLLTNLKSLARKAPAREALIVDDDEATRYVLSSLLSRSGLRPLQAAGGVDGVKMAKEHRPAVILLDLMMPDMNGFKALELLKSDTATLAIPVIVHTGKALTTAERKRLKTGAFAVIQKNLGGPEAVAEEIQKCLALAAGQAHTGASGSAL